MVTLMNYTRNEFLEIFRNAKARKVEWQKQAEKELNEMSDRITRAKIENKKVFG
jgi:hypothetical protein